MSFFKNIFGSSEDEISKSKVNWITLNDINQLDEIVAESKFKPVVIFKHSTSCSISRMALKGFERDFDLDDEVLVYFLDLLNFRDVSNKIASMFDVRHQSPQILIIKDGISIYNASHENIDVAILKEKL
ncbi:bacillithiol system redox-active protein YtxJ [Flavobacterium sp.]|uniref:bacillithiol system redox-active protein YtxJ n=1 Tax=Flavobacterium sp. TaxID=239 RepID=UPI0037536D90